MTVTNDNSRSWLGVTLVVLSACAFSLAGFFTRRIGLPGLVAAGCSAAATICFVNALRQTTVADVLVINATAPFMTAGLAWAWAGDRERWTTLAASGVALVGVALIVGAA